MTGWSKTKSMVRPICSPAGSAASISAINALVAGTHANPASSATSFATGKRARTAASVSGRATKPRMLCPIVVALPAR